MLNNRVSISKNSMSNSFMSIPSVQQVPANYQDNGTVFPIPAGYTMSLEPFFAPHVNFSPFPVGYTSTGIPYYGKTNLPKYQPTGLTISGIRYYPAEDKAVHHDSQSKNLMAGYDMNGHPFYIPRGFNIPPPSGFTIDGIPYYDIPTLMRQNGIMVLPSTFLSIENSENDEESWGKILSQLNRDDIKGNVLQKGRLEALFLSRLSSSLVKTQPELKYILTQAHLRPIIPFKVN